MSPIRSLKAGCTPFFRFQCWYPDQVVEATPSLDDRYVRDAVVEVTLKYAGATVMGPLTLAFVEGSEGVYTGKGTGFNPVAGRDYEWILEVAAGGDTSRSSGFITATRDTGTDEL